MKRMGFIVMSLMLLLAFSAIVSAEGNDGCSMKGRMAMGIGPKMVLAMASELNLTTDQMDKLKKISDDMTEQNGKNGDMKKQMEEMKAEMQKDSPDEAKIDALIDKAAEQHKTAIKARIKVIQSVSAILTSQQKDILKKKMDEKKAKMEKHTEKMKDK
jgi:Spy/CpxP family protein refolding chaperone